MSSFGDYKNIPSQVGGQPVKPEAETPAQETKASKLFSKVKNEEQDQGQGVLPAKVSTNAPPEAAKATAQFMKSSGTSQTQKNQTAQGSEESTQAHDANKTIGKVAEKYKDNFRTPREDPTKKMKNENLKYCFTLYTLPESKNTMTLTFHYWDKSGDLKQKDFLLKPTDSPEEVEAILEKQINTFAKTKAKAQDAAKTDSVQTSNSQSPADKLIAQIAEKYKNNFQGHHGMGREEMINKKLNYYISILNPGKGGDTLNLSVSFWDAQGNITSKATNISLKDSPQDILKDIEAYVYPWAKKTSYKGPTE